MTGEILVHEIGDGPGSREDLLSILCVTYNHAQFARHGLESIFAQTYRNIEIVVLDDGSTDCNISVLKATLEKSPFPFKLIKQENSGNVPQNFNRARSAASGTFLGFLSLDDQLKPDFAKTHVRALRSDADIAFSVDALHDVVDEWGAVIKRNVPMPVSSGDMKNGNDLLECEFESIGAFYIQSAVVRANVFDAVGGFDDDITGDDIVLRTKIFQHLIENPELYFILNRRVGFEYRLHSDNLHHNNFRQIKTVVEWRNRFFPDRPLPELAERWIRSFVDRAIFEGQADTLEQVMELGEDVAVIIDGYTSTARFRGRRIKAAVKRAVQQMLGIP